MNYSQFLFSKLLDLVHPTDMEYDTLHDHVERLWNEYESSECNDLCEPEYECMIKFLISKTNPYD